MMCDMRIKYYNLAWESDRRLVIKRFKRFGTLRQFFRHIKMQRVVFHTISKNVALAIIHDEPLFDLWLTAYFQLIFSFPIKKVLFLFYALFYSIRVCYTWNFNQIIIFLLKCFCFIWLKLDRNFFSMNAKNVTVTVIKVVMLRPAMSEQKKEALYLHVQ